MRIDSRAHRVSLARLAGLLLALFSLPLLGAAAPGFLSIRRVELSRKPAWTVSGAFGPDGSLILVDALFRKACRFTPSGIFLDEISSPTSSSKLAFPKPSIINAIPGGFLLESEDGHLIRLDDRLKPVGAVDLLAESKGPRHEIGALYGWTPLGKGERILAFADIRKANGNWFSAFIRVPLKEPAKFEVLKRMELTDPARNFYLLGNLYLASIGETGYFALMDQHPYIYEVPANSSEPRRLFNGPATRVAGERPQLAEKQGIESARAVYASLEHTKNFLSGLYAADDSLYLLKRTAGASGTTWLLSKIDPASPSGSKVVYTRTLPTRASHLTVVPGPNEWAFVEKGAVTGVLEQKIASAVFLPSEAIEGH
jgi:hypothetical protein